MDHNLCKIIQAEALAALKAVAAKHGLEVNGKGGKYDSAQVTLKFEFAGKAEKSDRLKHDFRTFAASVGLKPADFGKTFKWGGVEYRISGFLRNRPSKCIQITRTHDGKTFIAKPDHIAAALKA